MHHLTRSMPVVSRATGLSLGMSGLGLICSSFDISGTVSGGRIYPNRIYSLAMDLFTRANH